MSRPLKLTPRSILAFQDGSTDGFHKIVELLCEHGDGILVESFTYPSALETGWPMGVRPVTVEIDGELSR